MKGKLVALYTGGRVIAGTVNKIKKLKKLTLIFNIYIQSINDKHHGIGHSIWKAGQSIKTLNSSQIGSVAVFKGSLTGFKKYNRRLRAKISKMLNLTKCVYGLDQW